MLDIAVPAIKLTSLDLARLEERAAALIAGGYRVAQPIYVDWLLRYAIRLWRPIS